MRNVFPQSSRLPRSLSLRATLALAGLLLLAVIAESVARGNLRTLGLGLALALSPVVVWAALRFPLLFPFGIYLAFVPFDPLLQISAGGATLTKFAGIATIVALVARTILVRRALVPQRSWFGWLAVITYASLSLIWSIDVEATKFLLGAMLSLFALYTALAIYPIAYVEFLWVRRILIAAGIATAAYGAYAFRSGQHTLSGPHHNLDRLTITNGTTQFDPNHYAAFFLIPIAIVVVGFFVDPRPLRKLAYGGTFALLASSVLLSGSRGGLIGIAVIVVYLGIRTRKFISMGAVAAMALALSAFIPSVWQRFADPTQGDGSGRSEIWATGLRGLREFWIAGSGFGTYPDVYDSYLLQAAQRTFAGVHRPSHSIIVEAAIEFGVLGSIALAVALWWSLRANARLPRSHPLFVHRLEAEGMFAGVVWMALTIDVLWYKYFWLTLSFGLLLANVYRSRAREGYATPVGRKLRSEDVGTTERMARTIASTPARLESTALAPEI